MNYTGLGYANRYKVDRPLTEQECKQQLDPARRSGFEPSDALTAIRINSTYLEVVDRWYALKGTAVWMAVLIMLPFSWFTTLTLGLMVAKSETGAWLVGALGVVVFGGGGAAAFFLGFRLEAFRWTHYPINGINYQIERD